MTALELIGISKAFGPVQANHDINLDVETGTIHGIVGENGAGKSTLMSIIYGFYEADSGQIKVAGQAVDIRSSAQAIELGIGMVHQHFMLVEPLSALENIVLGMEGGWTLDNGLKAARKKLEQLQADYSLKVDLDTPVGELPIGAQQRVEILKALYRDAEVLILDEPTGVLTPEEADQLFRVLAQLKAQGKTVVLITHKLREIMAITDRVSVMRRGTMVDTLTTADTSTDQLAELMVGRDVSFKLDKRDFAPGPVRMRVQNLNHKDESGVARLKSINFELHSGEILGIAGVSGNGQSELLEILGGLYTAESGELTLGDKTIDLAQRSNPTRRREKGLGHVPEDRHRMGLVTKFEANENSILGYHHRVEKNAFMRRSKLLALAEDQMQRYDVRPPNPRLKTANFSGGNQQKLVIAREIEQDPEVLIVGQPTRGVDIGAIEAIHTRLLDLRAQGKAILLVSVELDEIRAMADRVLVMYDGQIMGEVAPDASDAEIGQLMAGVSQDPDQTPQAEAHLD